jgi:hypothetical protein
MGLFDRWKRRKKEEASRREDLQQLGILVTGSDELETRIERRKEILKEIKAFENVEVDEEGNRIEPTKAVEVMLTELNKIDDLLKEISVPWGRGGTTDWYGKAMLGWEGLVSKGRNIVLACYDLAKKSEEKYLRKIELVRKLKGFLIVEVLRYAQYISDVSYYESDVTAKYNIVLSQQVQPGATAGPIPRAGSLLFPSPPSRETEEMTSLLRDLKKTLEEKEKKKGG